MIVLETPSGVLADNQESQNETNDDERKIFWLAIFQGSINSFLTFATISAVITSILIACGMSLLPVFIALLALPVAAAIIPAVLSMLLYAVHNLIKKCTNDNEPYWLQCTFDVLEFICNPFAKLAIEDEAGGSLAKIKDKIKIIKAHENSSDQYKEEIINSQKRRGIRNQIVIFIICIIIAVTAAIAIAGFFANPLVFPAWVALSPALIAAKPLIDLGIFVGTFVLAIGAGLFSYIINNKLSDLTNELRDNNETINSKQIDIANLENPNNDEIHLPDFSLLQTIIFKIEYIWRKTTGCSCNTNKKHTLNPSFLIAFFGVISLITMAIITPSSISFIFIALPLVTLFFIVAVVSHFWIKQDAAAKENLLNKQSNEKFGITIANTNKNLESEIEKQKGWLNKLINFIPNLSLSLSTSAIMGLGTYATGMSFSLVAIGMLAYLALPIPASLTLAFFIGSIVLGSVVFVAGSIALTGMNYINNVHKRTVEFSSEIEWLKGLTKQSPPGVNRFQYQQQQGEDSSNRENKPIHI